MAIIFTGNHVCNSCGETFEWSYDQTVRARLDAPVSSIIVEDYPEGKNLVHRCISKGDGSYEIGAYCDNCGIYNTFDYTP